MTSQIYLQYYIIQNIFQIIFKLFCIAVQTGLFLPEINTNIMDKEKKLHMIKSFHVAPEVVKDFEALRLQMCARLGYRIGSADFFAWLVRQAKQSQEVPGTFKNFSE